MKTLILSRENKKSMETVSLHCLASKDFIDDTFLLKDYFVLFLSLRNKNNL